VESASTCHRLCVRPGAAPVGPGSGLARSCTSQVSIMSSPNMMGPPYPHSSVSLTPPAATCYLRRTASKASTYCTCSIRNSPFNTWRAQILVRYSNTRNRRVTLAWEHPCTSLGQSRIDNLFALLLLPRNAKAINMLPDAGLWLQAWRLCPLGLLGPCLLG
jgi:hypothetical protein